MFPPTPVPTLLVLLLVVEVFVVLLLLLRLLKLVVVLMLLVGVVCGPTGLLDVLVLVEAAVVEAVVELWVQGPPPMLEEEEVVVMVVVVRVAVELIGFASPFPPPMLTVTVIGPPLLVKRKTKIINAGNLQCVNENGDRCQ